MMKTRNMEKPSVGVAVVVFKDGKILLGQDLGKDDKPVYGVPGGHWESGETLSDGIKREVKEEAGIEITNLHLISVYEFFRKDKNKSYVTIGFRADYKSGKLKDESATTRKNWNWFSLSQLPSPLFAPDKVLILRSQKNAIWEER